jgi:hypothetical protein
MTLLFRIKRLFKRDPEIKNIYHKDLEGKIEPAFKANGKQYYRFIKEVEMFWGRYMFMQTFLHEQTLRLESKMLEKYMDSLEKILNGNNKGVIELGKAFQIIGQIKSRCVLAFEVDTTYRLASVIYFDDTEDLWLYDKKYNDSKIATWKEARTVDFFYHQPMKEFLNLSDSLPADLVTYMEQQKEILGGLTSAMPGQ